MISYDKYFFYRFQIADMKVHIYPAKFISVGNKFVILTYQHKC